MALQLSQVQKPVAKCKARWYSYSDGIGHKRKKLLIQCSSNAGERFELMGIFSKECHHRMKHLIENIQSVTSYVSCYKTRFGTKY